MSTARAVLRALRNVLLPKSVRVRTIPFGLARGARMKIDFRLHTAVYFGVYETELNRYFKTMVRPGSRCFDVGANVGFDAIALARLSGGGPVVTFECGAELLPLLRENIACNASLDIRLVHAYVSGPGDASGLTLDEAARRHFVPDFIKMDIEGAEAEALRGAAEILSRRQPGLVIETHGSEKLAACREILRGHGYEQARVVEPRRGWLKEMKGSAEIRWLVCAGAGAGSEGRTGRPPVGRELA